LICGGASLKLFEAREVGPWLLCLGVRESVLWGSLVLLALCVCYSCLTLTIGAWASRRIKEREKNFVKNGCE